MRPWRIFDGQKPLRLRDHPELRSLKLAHFGSHLGRVELDSFVSPWSRIFLIGEIPINHVDGLGSNGVGRSSFSWSFILILNQKKCYCAYSWMFVDLWDEVGLVGRLFSIQSECQTLGFGELMIVVGVIE